MRALILDGARAGETLLAPVAAALGSALVDAGYEPTSIALSELEISSCRGDFGCWIKTPGECTIDDEARDIACGIVHSDLVVFLTRITFGGYSSELKKMLDRAIGIVLPQFAMIRGEVHHKARYQKYPDLLAVGVCSKLDPEAAEVFARLVRQNASNLHSPRQSTVILQNATPPEEMRRQILLSLETRKAVRG
jgi:hypothetical protein